MGTNGNPLPITLILIQHNKTASGIVWIGDRRQQVLQPEMSDTRLNFIIRDEGRFEDFDLVLADGKLIGEASLDGQNSRVSLSMPLPKGQGITPPKLISKVEPKYTEAARQARIEGTVWLYGEVGAEGKAENIEVVEPLDPGLDQRAIECLRKWKFTPAQQNGKAITIGVTFQVNFRLRR